MLIVYNSFGGWYSDSPRALYRTLTADGRSYDHVWLRTATRRDLFPRNVETVVFGTPECQSILEHADVILSNDHMLIDWEKRSGSTYLQTWHGTPLKHVHHDTVLTPSWRRRTIEDIDRWDYLLSPNSASTARLRHAFEFSGPVLETGYPRNDILVSPRAKEIRARSRARLRIPDDVTAVLYAPTWRDDVLDEAGEPDFRLGLDLHVLSKDLGPAYALLLRRHPALIRAPDTLAIPGVRDVSDWQDIGELYLAADLLVTDYSSAMFDYAVTAKPIVLFTYDYDHYRDRLRGFYFDIRECPPGPVIHNSGDLTEAILQAGQHVAAYRSSYAAFRREFCHLDDGHSAERVVAALSL